MLIDAVYNMLQKLIPVLKIVSAVSFLFLLTPGEKIAFPMWLALLAGLFLYGGFLVFCFWVLILINLLFIVLAMWKNTLSHDGVSLMALLLLYIPVAKNIPIVFMYSDPLSTKTYIFFITVSLITIILIGIRMIVNEYADKRSVLKFLNKKFL